MRELEEWVYLGEGPGDDLESEIYRYMVELAEENGILWASQNQWGTTDFMWNSVLYEVQWTYVGLENDDYREDEDGQYWPAGEWYWEYDSKPDFEVSCLCLKK